MVFFILANHDETQFYSGSKDGCIKIWNVVDNKIRCIGDINAHPVIF